MMKRFLPVLLLSFLLPGALPAQSGPGLAVRGPQGHLAPGIALAGERGFAAFRARELARLGWVLEEGEGVLRARWQGGEPGVELRAGNPFLRWGGEGVQLADVPYQASGELHLPLQLLVDILPGKLPEAFRFHPREELLELLPQGPAAGVAPEALPRESVPRPAEAAPPGAPRPPPRPANPVRVVVIDPGHGGHDPGAVGPRGTREKDVALGIGLALARALRGEPGLEVYMTREGDSPVPLWRRGEEATRWKGDRPGVFISIHANALPEAPRTRGFETYFLSEARTEHERRVAALENSAMELEAGEGRPGGDPDLSFILRELRNLDHQHWSSLLAELVQGQLQQVHPGPNRGVKQGPFAVITNALMPSVLLEVGFITNPQEEQLLAQRSFQENAARAVARAVREFFRRYPPGWEASAAGVTSGEPPGEGGQG